MKINIISLGEEQIWKEAFLRLPPEEQQPGFLPDWYRVFSHQGDVRCCIATENSKTLLYPFLLNSINDLGYILDQPYFDIQGAPGYNGIASNSDDPEFFSDFEKRFHQWCTSENIVAEFIRFNPLVEDHKRISQKDCFHVNDNVIVDLGHAKGSDPMGFLNDRKRRYLRKAEREGMVFVSESGESVSEMQLEAFVKVYSSTMIRKSADKESEEGIDFFRELAKQMGLQCRFYFAVLDETVVSSELVILSSTYSYSYLGGTLEAYFDWRPNLFLKAGILRDLIDSGITHYILGGGQQPGDGIYQYKKSFAPDGVHPFFIGKRVHLTGVYQEVRKQWEERYPEGYLKYGERLLGYRHLDL